MLILVENMSSWRKRFRWMHRIWRGVGGARGAIQLRYTETEGRRLAKGQEHSPPEDSALCRT